MNKQERLAELCAKFPFKKGQYVLIQKYNGYDIEVMILGFPSKFAAHQRGLEETQYDHFKVRAMTKKDWMKHKENEVEREYDYWLREKQKTPQQRYRERKRMEECMFKSLGYRMQKISASGIITQRAYKKIK